ncbi:reverse transcriptase domain-containing protein [Tanacetum coccineum]
MLHGKKLTTFSMALPQKTHRGHYGANLTAKKTLISGLPFGPPFNKDAHEFVKNVTRANDKEKLRNGMKASKLIQVVKSLTFMRLTLWARSRHHEGTNIFSCRSLPAKKGRSASAPTNDARVVMQKYGVTHRLSTAYHPQTSGQVEVSNRGLKRILERTIGENRASWSDKLDDALWAFRHLTKRPSGVHPYKLCVWKGMPTSIELEHKAYGP